MNVKLHTPSTLKAGSGLSSTKQFFLSLIATTISIVLTFGTAAVIDHHKKVAAKKEMVMMVISDMDRTIELLEKADTLLRESCRLQQEIAIHPERYDSLCLRITPTFGWIYEDFSEITEKIFTTSIETFNTIGDVNFVNEVSSFYLARRKYKEMVWDKLREDLEREPIAQSIMSLLNIGFPDFVINNRAFMIDMKNHRDKCMQMMHVSEKDMSKFNKRQESDVVNPDNDNVGLEMYEEYSNYNTILEQAKEKLKK